MKQSLYNKEYGFSLVEVLLVLLILSILSSIMIYTATGARQIGVANQAVTAAQQNARMVNIIMERDLRLVGAGVYSNAFRSKNGGLDLPNEKLEPSSFDYDMGTVELQGFMIPPIEVNNGTNTEVVSYLNPVDSTAGLTINYREPGTDLITIYSSVDSGFTGKIDGYSSDNLVVSDPVVGARLLQIFTSGGGNPILIYLIGDEEDDESYATMRSVTNVAKSGTDYNLTTLAINDINQPATIVDFLKEVKPTLDTGAIPGNYIVQVSAAAYFVYSHPNPAMNARGWLVKLDMSSIISGGLTIDATDPDTIRPFVIAEHVSDFQVAIGIDSNDDSAIAANEWHNGEDMENYVHLDEGSGTVTNDFVDLINNLRAVRFSIVAHTDESSVENPFGFGDPNSGTFSSTYPTVAEVAEQIGITVTLEDRVWTRDALINRMWFRRAVQHTNVVKIRNLDLENTFARTQ